MRQFAEIDPKKFTEFKAKTGGTQRQQLKEPKEASTKKEKGPDPPEELNIAGLVLAEDPKSKDPIPCRRERSISTSSSSYYNGDEPKSISYFWK